MPTINKYENIHHTGTSSDPSIYPLNLQQHHIGQISRRGHQLNHIVRISQCWGSHQTNIWLPRPYRCSTWKIPSFSSQHWYADKSYKPIGSVAFHLYHSDFELYFSTPVRDSGHDRDSQTSNCPHQQCRFNPDHADKIYVNLNPSPTKKIVVMPRTTPYKLIYVQTSTSVTITKSTGLLKVYSMDPSNRLKQQTLKYSGFSSPKILYLTPGYYSIQLKISPLNSNTETLSYQSDSYPCPYLP